MATQENFQQKEIAIFDNLNAAQKAKELLQKSELALQNLSIEGDIEPYEKVAAMGTTVGGEAGILIGLFYGGTLGVIAVTILSTLVNGEVTNSTFNQLSIIGATLIGGFVGAIAGNRVRSAHLPEQKTKGNLNVPRRFRLLVDSGSDEIRKAQEMLGYPVG